MPISSINNKPLVVITAGDPEGIGPEITNKALNRRGIKGKADYIVIGSRGKASSRGKATARGGEEAFRNLVKAVAILNAVDRPKALVTAPLNKTALRKAGYNYGGHTEILKKLTGARRICMMFSAGAFRVALVTRHVALSRIPGMLTGRAVEDAATLFYGALRGRFGIRRPKIAVCGLNPHAGESGAMGSEEKKVIAPAVRRLRAAGVGVSGPFPADTIFRSLYAGEIDGVLAMYHDQALAPFKMLYFDKGVNVTLGLPFIRTSPDHGTAYDIAGTGRADPGSMEAAIMLAVKLARKNTRSAY